MSARELIRTILVWSLPAFLVGAVSVVLISAGDLYDYQDSVDGVHLPEVDAVVCLAGGRGRITQAADLWFRYAEHRKRLPVLYVSGMGHQSDWTTFSRLVRPGVLSLLKPEHVHLEVESANTFENASWFIRSARRESWRRILLVTSSYHMRRARLIFERSLQAAALPIQVESLSVIADPYDADNWASSVQGIRVTVEEYLKLVYYRRFFQPQALRSYP